MSAPRVRAAAVGWLALAALALSACGDPPTPPPVNPSMATSAERAGGMDALIAAAKAEGRLNAIALPRNWANYGGLIDGFEKKYGIEVTVDDPQGSSQAEIEAVKAKKGRPDAPDVLDVGETFARTAAREGLLAPYKVAPYDAIPANQKDPKARWYNNYGGYVSIGCDAKRIKVCPRIFADLLKPAYKGKVALNGDPTQAGSAFAGVYAAALANKGSFDDIQPGIDFFAKLSKAGNFTTVDATPDSVVKGRTPIVIDWDYVNLGYADEFRDEGLKWQVAIPFDGSFAQYYAMAVNKDAPHPAAARLWQEYLFSAEGQNLRLKGYARPVLMDAMEKNGTLDEKAAARLPTVEGKPEFPTEAQTRRAQETVDEEWANAVSG